MTGDVRTDGTVDEQHGSRDEHPAEPRTGPVRIIGAQRAGGTAGADSPVEEEPPAPEGEPAGFGPEDWATPSEPALPHWTEAPTGEVPAVLSRPGSGDDEDPWAAVPEPSWREERSDWDRADPLGAALWPGAGEGRPLAEADAAEREPWAFDLESGSAGSGELDEEDDLFESWDGGAAESGSRRGDDAGGGRWGDERVVLDEHDLDALDAMEQQGERGGTGGGTRGGPGPSDLEGNEEELPEGGPAWAPGGDHWDPDLVAGEKTTVMHLPGASGDWAGQPPPPPARAGTVAGVTDEAAGGALPEDAPGDEAVADAMEDEALAADLEARRGRRRWGGRPLGPAGAGAPGPEGAAPTAPSLAVRAPGGDRRRHEGAGARTRAGAPARPGQPTRRATSARRVEDSMSERAGRNIPVAIASGVAIGVLALVAFHFGTVPSMVVVTAVIGLAAVEAFAAFRRAGYHPATLLGLAAVVGLIVGAYDKAYQALPLVTVLLVAGTLVWHLVGVDRRAEPVRSSAATLLVYCWVGVLGSFAALLLAPSLFPDRHGIAYLLGALIAAVAYDVGALVVGAWVGRHPLSPVSPGKTWEGVIGGAVAALVLSIGVVHLIHPWTLLHAVALGVVVAVVSPIGDLCESMVKRRLGLKDMGRILPGHGGLLDRVDGLLFVLPATFYLIRAFHGG